MASCVYPAQDDTLVSHLLPERCKGPKLFVHMSITFEGTNPHDARMMADVCHAARKSFFQIATGKEDPYPDIAE